MHVRARFELACVVVLDAVGKQSFLRCRGSLRLEVVAGTRYVETDRKLGNVSLTVGHDGD